MCEWKKIIALEHERLCARLGVDPADVDVYIADYGAPLEQTTPRGTPIRNVDAGYLGNENRILLPILSGDDVPIDLPPMPPDTWMKPAWPVWRFELWHEVVHRLSNAMGCWAPREPGRKRSDGSTSEVGHGAGWFKAICRVAKEFHVDPEVLDTLLDR